MRADTTYYPPLNSPKSIHVHHDTCVKCLVVIPPYEMKSGEVMQLDKSQTRTGLDENICMACQVETGTEKLGEYYLNRLGYNFVN